jgi:hypothetical protein
MATHVLTNGDPLVDSDDHQEVDALSRRLSHELAIDGAVDTCCAVSLINYESERQMPDIMGLIQKDLSEPYSIYTYRYFIHNWPHLCFLVGLRSPTTVHSV